MLAPSDNAAAVCTACGACCAAFRVSFYWAEAEELAIPRNLVEHISPVYSCMAGSNQKAPRCAALEGEIGRGVRCGIYLQRPSPCHEVQIGDARCQQARAKHGLGAL